MEDKTLRKAFHNWEEISMTQEQYLAYEARLKHIMDEDAAKVEEELRLQEAVEEATKEGMEKGIKQGIQEKEAIAYRLLKRGMTVEEVVDLTQIKEDRVIEIQQDVQNNNGR